MIDLLVKHCGCGNPMYVRGNDYDGIQRPYCTEHALPGDTFPQTGNRMEW